MIKLSKRLHALSEMVPLGAVLADVGCDHGFIPLSLIERGCIKKAFCLDINRGPLDRALENARSMAMDNKIIFIECDGMEGLKSDNGVDTALIAGMGGKTILHILLSAPNPVMDGIKTFILGPQSEIALFRRCLLGEGFSILLEKLVEENGKYYPLMLAEKKPEKFPYSEAELYYGRHVDSGSREALSLLIGNDISTAERLLSSGKLSGEAARHFDERLQLAKEALNAL